MEALIEIDGVSKFYSEHKALQQVSFGVLKGRILGLLGPNGAGKTSLIRIITQITGADEGEVRFDGKRLQPEHIKRIGYLPEERGLYKKMKVGEQLMYLTQLKGLQKSEIESRLAYWLKTFGMRDWWNKKVEDLSKGMQQKVQFVSTVLHDPELIILDEPFSGFDPVNANLIKDEILKLKEKGTTIIFSTHRMESVEELCDDIVLIHRSKKILEGEKNEIKESFRNQVFELSSEKEIQSIEGEYEVLSAQQEGRGFHTKLKAREGLMPNELLKFLLPQTEIYAFREKLPSINDIFIDLVNAPENIDKK